MSLNLPTIKSGGIATTTQYELLRVGNDPALYLPLDAPASSGVTVSVPVATLTLTANAPSVTATANQTVSVPAASLTLTGNAPTVTASANQTVAVPAGTLSITGFAPDVQAGAAVSVSVPVGALALTCYAPAVNVSEPAETGAGGGWALDFGSLEKRIAEEREDRESRRAEIERIYRQATGKALIDVAQIEALPARTAKQKATKSTLLQERAAIAEIDAAIDRLERQIEAADMAYIMSEEADIVWIASTYA